MSMRIEQSIVSEAKIFIKVTLYPAVTDFFLMGFQYYSKIATPPTVFNPESSLIA
jgi:hypothetical protein